MFGGGPCRLLAREAWSIDARSALERFISPELRDYWRWRNRAMVNWTMRVGLPYISGESMVQQGIWYGRYTGGMQWKVSPRVTLGAGYEYRQAPVGPGSHVIATFLQWSAYTHTPPHVD